MKRIAFLLAFLIASLGTLSAQWEQVSNLVTPAAINNMDIDGSALYAGTYEFGVHKSTNNGASWTKLNVGIDSYYPIVKASGTTVVVHSRYWGDPLLYSTNGGASFQAGATPDGSLSSFLVDGPKVFVLCDGGLMVSTDNGETLTSTSVIPAGFNYGQIVKSSIGYLLVGIHYDPNTYEFVTNFAYHSTDGVNWTDIAGFGGGNPLPNTPYSVGFNTAGYTNGTILVGMNNWDYTGALYGSTDMGENWFPIAPSLFPNYVGGMVATSSKVFISNFAGSYASSDLTNWTNVSNQVSAVFDGVGTTWAGSNAAGNIALSTNNGTTWQATSGQINGTDIVVKYSTGGNGTYVGTMYSGVFKKTTNGWNKVLGTGINGGGNLINDVLQKGNTILAGIESFDHYGAGAIGIFRSTNNGQSWTTTYPYPAVCLYDDGNALYAGVFEGVLKSTNMGQTWTLMNNGLPTRISQRRPSAFERIGNNLIVGSRRGHIYVSNNHAASWTIKRPSTSGSGINCLQKYGSTVLAGVENGMLRSTDQGETWEFLQNEVLGLYVTRMTIGPDNVLYVGTSTDGLFTSTDGGVTLVPCNDGVGDYTFVSALSRDGGKVFAGWNEYSYDYYGLNRPQGGLLWSLTPENLTAPDDRNNVSTASDKLSLEIFPNPVQDILRYKTNVEPALIAGVAVINTRGEIVRDLKTSDSRAELDVHDLPVGTYFFRMTMQDGKQLARQFVLQGKR